MKEKLVEMLHLEMEPVGIYFGNTSIDCDLDASADKRNCVVPFLVSAAKGKVVSLNEESCNCAGGAVGCCFGNGFNRFNPNIHKLLSQGFGDNAPPDMPEQLVTGERFFCSEEIALKWVNAMPYSERAYPRIVFAPMSKWDELGIPDLVYVFANADQISALVGMLGSHNGRATNTILPYGAACHSILYGSHQLDSDDPMAVMGFFDISQRRANLADYLSLTMPYPLWEGLTLDLDKSCLTTHSWKEIEKRL